MEERVINEQRFSKNLRVVETEIIETEVNFYDSETCSVRWGFSMENDEPIFNNEYAKENYEKCLKEVEAGTLYKKINTTKRYFTNRYISCDVCGKEFMFFNEFYGSCGCPNCEEEGRSTWYNFAGSHVCDPDAQRKCEDF